MYTACKKKTKYIIDLFIILANSVSDPLFD